MTIIDDTGNRKQMHEKAILALKDHCEKLLQMNLRNAEYLGGYSVVDMVRFDEIDEIKETIAFLESVDSREYADTLLGHKAVPGNE